ncbi:MAG: hypothetical protein KDB00_09350 [Planctomycetales bacterium]|nr:hypothetical protein [Planctomycetales bacterium]
MRAMIAIAVVLLILGLIGWIQFSSPGGDPTIRVDSQKVKQDTSVLVEKSKQAVESAAEKVESATEKVDASIARRPIDETNE